MPTFDPNALGTPNRGTSEAQLDQWNRSMRGSSVYQNYLRRYGLSADGRVRLSNDQQSGLERELRSAGFNIPSGMHIDQGGNLNQRNRLGRNIAIGAAATGAALTGFGLAGMGPLSGLGGGAAASGAAGTGAASASGSLAPIAGGAPWAVTPYAATVPMAGTGAGAAGAVGAGVGAATRAGATGALGGAYGPLTKGDLIKMGVLGAGTVAGAMSNNDIPNQPTSATTDPQMQKLIQTMQGRLDQSDPLYRSIMAMANGLLPTQYQNR